MRYQEMVTELESTDFNLDKIVIRKCSDILKAYRNNGLVFYRGMNGMPEHAIIQARNDRKPRDTNPMDHEFFDIMARANNQEVLRSNSIAVTTNFSQAASYGDPYIIFPFNGVKFLTSDVEHDFGGLVFESLDDFLRQNIQKLNISAMDQISLNKYMVQDIDGRILILKDLLQNPAFKQHFYNRNKPLLINQWNHYEQVFKLNNTNINTAIKLGHEVMMTGADFLCVRHSSKSYDLLDKLQIGN